MRCTAYILPLIFMLLLAVQGDAQIGQWFKKKSSPKTLEIKDGDYECYILLDRKGDTIRIDAYLKGKLHGKNMRRFNRDRIEVTHYEQGLKHGKYYRLGAKGKLRYSENYDHGKLQGVARAYHDNGKIAREDHYQEDTLKSRTTYFPDGSLEHQLQFLTFDYQEHQALRKLHGLNYFTWSNKSRVEVLFERGWSTGIEKGWNEAGELQYESFMKNDSTRIYYYYENGMVVDSNLQRFWAPFKHPLFLNGNIPVLKGHDRMFFHHTDEHYAEHRGWQHGALGSIKVNNSYREYFTNGRNRKISHSTDRYNYHSSFYNQAGKIEKIEIIKNKGRSAFKYKKTFTKNSGEIMEKFNFRGSHRNQIDYSFELRNGTLSYELIKHHTFFKTEYQKQHSDKVNTINWAKYGSGLYKKQLQKQLQTLGGRLRKNPNFFKEEYQVEDDQYPFYRGVVKDGRYDLRYKNGQRKFLFTLKDSLISKEANIYFGLPNGQPFYEYHIQQDITSAPVRAMKKLGFTHISSADSVISWTTYRFSGDTLFSETYLNGSLIYMVYKGEDEDEITRAHPTEDFSYRIKLYKNGQIKKKDGGKIISDVGYHKNGDLQFDDCNLRSDSSHWLIRTKYFRNGKPNIRQEIDRKGKEAKQRYDFYRSGKLKTVFINDRSREYKRNGKQYATGYWKRNYKGQREYNRVNDKNQKVVTFIRGKRQYRSILLLKGFPKWAYSRSKIKIRNGYQKTKLFAQKTARKTSKLWRKVWSKRAESKD